MGNGSKSESDPFPTAPGDLQVESWTALEKIAQLTGLLLPDYAFELAPRLCYQISPNDTPFEYQFQVWFAPQAHCTRWHRIERVMNLLDGYVSACYRLLNPEGPGWTCSGLVGIDFDPAKAEDNDRDLALAYAYLKVPISLPSSWAIPENYSLQDAQAVLLSNKRGSAKGRLSFATLLELPETDHDALIFSRVRPDYAEYRYNADSSRLTKRQCKEHNEGESTDLAEDEVSDIGSIGDAPYPADKITKVMEDMQPASKPLLVVSMTGAQTASIPEEAASSPEAQPKDLVTTDVQITSEPLDQSLNDLQLALPVLSTTARDHTLQLNMAISFIPPLSTSNPASASTLAPASTISSTSSANAPPQSRSGAPSHRECAARKQ